ncbi:MAG: hypothetical protein NWE78_04270 [Candidatus Bathyarchaeota archaeon]|nr:hypothetical protein [Candidatus Bathyarchaeota archaeon]
MDIKIILASIFVAILFFFGVIFALASAYAPSRLAVATILFAAGFGIIAVLYLVTRRRPDVVQRLELSGEMKAVPIKCPNCGASIRPEGIRIVDGVPYVTCKYCDHAFEVAEEPKW